MVVPLLGQDLRFAARSLRKSSGFSLMATLTLALGIGANTAIFSLINAVFLRPLPYDQPDRLVLVWESAPFFGVTDSPVAPANYFDWRARSRSFEEMGAIEDNMYRLTGAGNPEVLAGSVVSASVLRALRVKPAVGRIFTEEEDRPGAPLVALLSDACWRSHFASDPGVLGREVLMNGKKHTVVGVLAPGTEPPAEYVGRVGAIWTPLGSAYLPKELANRGRHNWMVIARLRPGVSHAAANEEMRAIGAALSKEYPGTNENVGAFISPLRSHFVNDSRRVLFLLLGAVAFVLLIACANLANLLLCRAANRSKEVGVRVALGAGRWELVRHFLAESLLLCAAGSCLGLLLAGATFQFLSRLAPGAISGMNQLSIDWRVLVFTLVVGASTAIFFGMVPLIQTAKVDVNHALKQGTRSLAGAPSAGRVRALLICSEVALAFILLIGAGLLIRTFARLRGIDPGFPTGNLLTLGLPRALPAQGMPAEIALQREILRKISEIPGVKSAGLTNHVPVAFKGDISSVGSEGRDPKDVVQCAARTAGPGYLRTVGISILRGRDIDERDTEGAPPVALINQTLATALWPGQDPIGRRIRFEAGILVPVVGVVADIHNSGLDSPTQPEFYISTLQAGFPAWSLLIRTGTDPAAISSAVRQAVWSIDRDQPVIEMRTMEQILDEELFARRTQMLLLGSFAALALLLAAIGLYGVLAYLVGGRIPEIGIRMALGAEPGDILRGILVQGLRYASVGLGIGILGAVSLYRVLSTVSYGVTPLDPLTYIAVAVILLLTALLASYIPAHRAIRVDPVVALRED